MSTPTTAMSESIEPALEGQRVGEYVVEGHLGRGAFGTVYRGVHPLIGKAVAIKVLSRRFSADPEMVSRFVAEARAVNQIRHRHIIDIFSFGQLEDGRHYYVMEYLEGETLQALLDREHRVPLARCLPILHAIGRALDAAHAKGIAHRDLKAENIFLGTDSDGGVWPKLLDFGIAKLVHAEDGLTHRTRSGISIGTPRYMSPEQCHGRQVDHRTDIYAFGVLVYLMLTGVFPFDGDSAMAILMKQVGAEPVPPSAHVAELPEAVDDVVLWLIHKAPTHRPPDLKTAVMVLEQAAERAGLITPTTWIPGWDATSGQARTLSSAIAVPQGLHGSRRGAATTGKEALVMGHAPKRARDTRESGHAAVGLVSGATAAAPPRSRAVPILAVASLVAIMATVATVVARYPREDAAPAHLAAEQAKPPAVTRPAEQGQGQEAPGLSPAVGWPAAQDQGQGAPGPSPAAARPEPAGQGPRVIPARANPGGVISATQLPPAGGVILAKQLPPARRVPLAKQPLPQPAPPQPSPARPHGGDAGKPTTRDDIIDVFGGGQP